MAAAADEESPAARLRFFGGKGGVGKTTCAAATALVLAEAGRRVLVVSTDPAHSLGDALGRRLSRAAARVATRRGALDAVEVDAERALGRWMNRRRAALAALLEQATVLDGDDVRRLLRLAPPGVDELIGLLEVWRLAGEGRYDEVVVDAAPTGHALRLLAMPGALCGAARALDELSAHHRFVVERLGGVYRPGAGDALIGELEATGRALHEWLRDRRRCRLAWVTLAEPLAVAEAKDAIAELRRARLPVAELVINRLTPAPARPCAGCAARRRSEAQAVAAIRAAWPEAPLLAVAAREEEPRGPAALRLIGRELARAQAPARSGPRRPAPAAAPRGAMPGPRDAEGWLRIVAPPRARLLLFVGKGGVGKTTCAAATAVAVAGRAPGRRVTLLSTDPAHSLGDALGVRLGDRPRALRSGRGRLLAREPDAGRALRRLRARHQALAASLTGGGAAFERSALRDWLELAPPGLDEVFGLLAILDALRDDALVVVDMPPTGHALRLLALAARAREWIRVLLGLLLKYRPAVGLGALARELTGLSRDLGRLDALLRDLEATRVVVVSRTGELPRLETGRLVEGLTALGLGVTALVVDAVSGLAADACPRCRRATGVERRRLTRLGRGATGACPVLLAPAVVPPPRGIAALGRWSRAWGVA